MHIGVPNETTRAERRVATSPQVIAALIAEGADVSVESGAGTAAGFTDEVLAGAGAEIVASLADTTPLDILLRVTPPDDDALKLIRDGGAVIGLLAPAANAERYLAQSHIAAVALESLPRSTLAQSMDALSSQATAAGYAAVLLGASSMPKFMPMMVTAAGTVPPAQVLVLGVGVAGLMAIATAKRLGAVVYAYDIRPETKEQVESLGGRFVDAPTQEMDEGGYARAVDDETAAKQREILSDIVASSDLVITTAQVPGRAAPRLIDRADVERMEPGTVIVDMAAASGGNVEGSVPGEVVEIGGVKVFGPDDLASTVAADSSRMLARNLLELVKRMTVDGELLIDPDDPVVGPALVKRETPDE